MDYGGQAVIEGVMMRSKDHVSTAVRLENGKIKVKSEKIKRKFPLLYKIFFLRGLFYLYETLKIGIKTLNWSANQQFEEEETPSGWFNAIVIIFSVLLALFIFKFIPVLIAKNVPTENVFLFNLVDGGTKLLFFIIYVWAISLSKEVRRVFRYHGAEHKSLGCLEKNKKLTPENCKKFSKEHKRCGTNFLFVVIFISIITYLIVPLDVNIYVNTLFRILLLPIIAGISYELLKIEGKYENFFT
ncbi:MAG: DUF1385 domain-containing protein, partial [Candidatus Woesearchaeota archaeon]